MKDKAIRKYYKGAATGEVDRTVKRFLKGKPEVVYGARSVNQRLPDYLEKFTEDWDVYSHTAKESAKELEKLLDEQFGGDYFEVRPAKHEGTFKVVSKVTMRGVADITIPERTISYQTIDGINYATLEEQVVAIERALSAPEFRFRWDRDKEALQRIELFEEYHKPKRRPAVKVMPRRKGLHKRSRTDALKGLRT